jgi:hypothetical protein
MKPFKFFNTNDITNTDDIRDFLMSEVPDYIVACGEIDAYRDGVNAGINSNGYNPYHDNIRGEIWNRGFWNATNLIHRR